MKNYMRMGVLFILFPGILLAQGTSPAVLAPVNAPVAMLEPASASEPLAFPATDSVAPVVKSASSAALVSTVASEAVSPNGDGVFELLQKKLPPGWTLRQASETLTIERTGDIWIMNTNRINAEPKLEFPKERQATIRDEGRKTRARMVFKVAPRLTLEQMKVLDDTNALIDAEIASLPEKLGVAAFLDVELSRKVGPVYTATAPEDLKRIEEFQKVREELSAKRLKYPDFNTENFSLWATEKEGWEDEFHEVHPHEAAQQSYEIYKALEDACKERLK